jgi:hypothetical protein
VAVEVFPLRLADAPEEIWYGVRVNGRSLEAGWADPDAARRRGEEYARELRSRGRRNVEAETPDQTLPEEPDEPDTKPVEPDEPGQSDEEHGKPDDPGKSEDAPGHNKAEPKDDDASE